MMNVVFWGTGNYAKKWLEQSAAYLKLINIIAFVDNKHINGINVLFNKIKVISPEEILTEQYDYICILSSFYEEIKEQIINIIGNDKNVVLPQELMGILIEGLYLTSEEYERPCLGQDFVKRLLMQNTVKEYEDFKLQMTINDYFDYEYLKKKYYALIEKELEYDFKIIHQSPIINPVWVCWMQGIESAPLIVQACIASIKKYMKDHTVIIITEQNMDNYVQFPDFITEKYKKGMISRTHFSDLLRIELLAQYGGIWIDSTVLMTKKLPEFICNADFFLFTDNNIRNLNVKLYCSWLIVSKAHQRVILSVRNLLYEYWRNNSCLLNYFLLHYFIRMTLEKYVDDKPLIIKPNSITLMNCIFDTYNEELYNAIKNIFYCQKLTYKIEIPEDYTNTFYEKILENIKN